MLSPPDEPLTDRRLTGLADRALRLREQWRVGSDRRSAFRRQVYNVIEGNRGDDFWANVVDYALISLIVFNVIVFTLETVPSLHREHANLFHFIDVVSVAIFTVEYALRIWTAVEVPFLRHLPDWKARLQFARRPELIIDLLAILPFYLNYLLPYDLRILRVLRLLRFLKLARYSPAMHTLVRVLANERRTLGGALMLVLTALLFSATGIYYLEHEAQPNGFGSIPQSAWWAVVTLATVGYGDVVPITVAGRIFASLVILCGLVVVALPIAIIANGFAQEAGRRDFVLTWSLISRIPLFAELDAKAVAELMRFLQAHNYPHGWEIAVKGAQADAMFFVASGRVRKGAPGKDVTFGTGDFFGEREMLSQSVFDEPVTAVSRTRLLKLHFDDFGKLNALHPDIFSKIRQRAEAEDLARNSSAVPALLGKVEVASLDDDG